MQTQNQPNSESASHERVLITGGSGFIGTNLVTDCLKKGWEVCNLSADSPPDSSQNQYWTKVDLLDAKSIRESFTKFSPTLVMHLGARTDLKGKSLEDYAANIQGVHNVLDAVQETQPKRAIYASSRLVFRIDSKPKHDYDYSATTWYGKSKIKTEEIIKERDGAGVPWTIVRPTSIWGPWFNVPYRTFFSTIEQGRYFHPRNHQILKSFGFVENVTYELLRLAAVEEAKVNKKVFFLADYEPLNVLEWAHEVQQELKAPPIKQLPYPVLKAGALVGDVLGMGGVNKFPLNSFRLNNLVCNMVYDLSNLQSVIGPLPYSRQEGVKRTCEWIRKHPQ
ncbi:MAG TPA: NAD(P)-dependent oxidoreductase [Abditibacterium sp.]|jgi:nucleoside-diphosphate-sugar epimerase